LVILSVQKQTVLTEQSEDSFRNQSELGREIPGSL